MIACTRCGATNQPTSRFCLSCGNPLVSSGPVASYGAAATGPTLEQPARPQTWGTPQPPPTPEAPFPAPPPAWPPPPAPAAGYGAPPPGLAPPQLAPLGFPPPPNDERARLSVPEGLNPYGPDFSGAPSLPPLPPAHAYAAPSGYGALPAPPGYGPPLSPSAYGAPPAPPAYAAPPSPTGYPPPPAPPAYAPLPSAYAPSPAGYGASPVPAGHAPPASPPGYAPPGYGPPPAYPAPGAFAPPPAYGAPPGAAEASNYGAPGVSPSGAPRWQQPPGSPAAQPGPSSPVVVSGMNSHDPAAFAATAAPPTTDEQEAHARRSQAPSAGAPQPSAGSIPPIASVPVVAGSSPTKGRDPEFVEAGATRTLAGFFISYDHGDFGVFWPIYQGRNVLGRKGTGSGVDIEIDHPTTSSRHAVVYASARPGRLKVEDGGSTNGTFLNEAPIDRARKYELCDNDTLRFGGFNVIVKII